MRRVVVAGDDWLWLVGAGVEPADDALAAFAAALDAVRLREPAVLLAGRVQTGDGRLDPASTPIAHTVVLDVILPAVAAGCLAILAAPAGSLLVRERALLEADLDPVAGEELAWTARLARRGPALLVPGSLAVRTGSSPRRPLLRRLHVLRGLLAAAPGPDRAWLAYTLLGRELSSPGRGRRAP